MPTKSLAYQGLKVVVRDCNDTINDLKNHDNHRGFFSLSPYPTGGLSLIADKNKEDEASEKNQGISVFSLPE